MTPAHLACPDTNSQLEPIRRAIESGVETRHVPEDLGIDPPAGADEDPRERDISGRSRYLSGYSSQVCAPLVAEPAVALLGKHYSISVPHRTPGSSTRPGTPPPWRILCSSSLLRNIAL